MDIKKIIIVGGGTAGWLAANHIGKAFEGNDTVSISLIESPDIPTIGVGEGTVPAIRKSLKQFGISESEFIRSCDVTFKQSIKFVNWMDKHRHGEGNFYHHLFDMPSPLGEDLTEYWLRERSGSDGAPSFGEFYGELVSPQHAVCESYKAPKQITHAEYEGSLGYAYHLNAAKFALLLASNAKTRFNVEHISANVVDVRLNETGHIESLKTDSQGRLYADFYIDCSGFEALLIDKALKVPFVDKSNELFVDRAVAVQVPIAEDAPIPPFTIATAHQAGWIWDIALTNRRGVGFVYSSKYMNEQTALKKLEYYLGEDLAQYQHRVLPMKVGYRKQFFYKNCLSLGLAQGFLEPLEATSILLTDFAAGYLASRFPTDVDELDLLSAQFNKVMTYAWERVVEFVKLHYCISDRSDSPFWIDNRDPSSIPPELIKRLTLWQTHIPIREDFFSKFEVFDLDNYLYVLYGMAYGTSLRTSLSTDKRQWKAHSERIKQVGDALTQELPQHRQLLDKIIRYGLQKT
ncbi:tryptophan halogenase family protein [Shewanella psychrotolerans]|uniref:tryptophan halogenase family protein n=1 Tax=Shewanella psychrotolerans TaxID=2864206 RepID=UPI001C658692|nr:tryptophan halogenase family protein [Shewanella psychrotolerans]QYK00591.1 tryptophan 7-halogenase [Shewanella psychrotolerans]